MTGITLERRKQIYKSGQQCKKINLVIIKQEKRKSFPISVSERFTHIKIKLQEIDYFF